MVLRSNRAQLYQLGLLESISARPATNRLESRVDDEWFMLTKGIIALPVPLIHAAWNETKTAIQLAST
jgi:hypothetical protein